MAEIISREKELIRINPTKRNKLEYSRDGGRVWNGRYSNTLCGDFRELADATRIFSQPQSTDFTFREKKEERGMEGVDGLFILQG